MAVAVVIPLTPAPLWRRAVARALDGLVGVAVWALGSMWLVIAAWGARRAPLELREGAVLALVILALGAVLHLVYFVAFIGGCGQTPGAMALGIAVVTRDGARASYLRALVRCLAGVPAALSLGILSVGVLVTRERRGLADWLAGTRVVRV